MKFKLGYATASLSKDSVELEQKLESILEFKSDVVELSLTRAAKMQHPFTSKIINLLNRFEYRSIHAPVVGLDGQPLEYPSQEVENLLDIIDKIAEDMDPHSILVHPDLVKDFDWLNQRYGDKLAFENMDSKKNFGKSVEDMRQVFTKSPQAKFVFDINHIYTNDKTMASASDFFNEFKHRLAHYHVSSLGDFHDCFCLTHEDVILEGLKSLDYPMVHEGNALEKGVMKQEYEYVRRVVGE